MASQVYGQSLEIKDGIEDVGGKAATLANMDHLQQTAGEREVSILSRARAWPDLTRVLLNLGVVAGDDGGLFLA